MGLTWHSQFGFWALGLGQALEKFQSIPAEPIYSMPNPTSV